MAKTMSVQVQKGQVRSTPTFLGKILATVAYGTQVSVLEKKNGWIQMTVPGTGTKGWMHSSALTKKKVVLKAGAADVKAAATSDELALAGKGFNAQVESDFKSKNPELDFTWIDKMEKIVVSERRMQRFLASGEVFPEGGVG